MWDYHILLIKIILILMKNEELLKEFLSDYSPAKVSNWLSFMTIYKEVIPYVSSKLVYQPKSHYTLTFKPFEFIEDEDSLIVYDDMNEVLDILIIEDKVKRAKAFADFSYKLFDELK